MSELQNKADALIHDIEAALDEATRIEAREKNLAEQEADLHARHKELEQKEITFRAKETRFEEEKAYLIKKNAEVKEKELTLQFIEKEKKALAEREKQAQIDEERIGKEQAILDNKMESVTMLEQRKKELDYRESLLKKESLTTMIKKEMVDKQEDDNTIEARRLQKIAQELGEKKPN